MDVRRIRPLFLPPHPRRNQYTPIYKGELYLLFLRPRGAVQDSARRAYWLENIYAFSGSG